MRRRGKEFVMVVRGPEIDDGTSNLTSAVMWFDRKNMFCRTINRLYCLGQPAGREVVPVDGVKV